ncbi:cAMP-mediated signaling protein Sok1 [Drechmeria coniospora]|uniref:cAMP-mediated signaling protein Sok1 n=1 Tax=Drechmeria coniospora TaxID=98403 RepID=A0A151GFF7_DRECN|nr:cAMP-mediated signaling protein Sok1 [Drechmeria coniospora]KYK55806.1 cAMP-mediated signaling protein Sok1 [Drechmeria coniospora]ODA81603.1 hypothetical protein RJ55_00103 [Drechmeria coniospora]
MMDQGYGGGSFERSRRSLSTSAPVPNGDGESIKDTDIQLPSQPPNEVEKKAAAQSSQESPRRCEAAVRTSTPSTRRSSPASSPPAEAAVGRRSSRHSPPRLWPVEPPVTRSTLSELDVSKIIHNPKLRHDINFDPELHFRPNLDGEKGRRKQDKANLFWKALKDELAEFLANAPAFHAKHGEADDWTLPSLLRAVKDIIQTLVPQRDRQFLDEGLNVELLMQQFRKGIADFEKLALWLSQVLKSHCAPMRDDWVDAMYAQLSRGNRDADLDELVAGMRSLLGVLEAMKLDVANHQIRCLRPVLIEDTTHFEQKFFLRKMQSRKVDVGGARRWYRDADVAFSARAAASWQSFGDMAVFFEALTRLVLPSTAEKRVPSTFLFDEERIMKLRSDVLDAVNLDVCMRMYEDLDRLARFSSKIQRVSRALDDGSLDRRAEPPPPAEFNFNSPPSTSRPSSLAFSAAGSAESSPRSSLALPSYVAPENCEARAKARAVYDSLVALLQSATPTSRPYARWQEMAPSMAIQIFRFTAAPSDMLPAFEAKLTENVCKGRSQLYLEVEQAFHRMLMSELGRQVREFKPLSAVSLFAAATGGRAQGTGGPVRSPRARDAELARDEGRVEDVAVRLAHMGVLHWRVWSPLVYLADADDSAVDVAMTQA